MVIIIYTKSEVLDFKKTKEQENEVIKKCIQKDADSIKMMLALILMIQKLSN